MRGLDWQFMWENLSVIVAGIQYTLLIAVVSIIFGTLIGLSRSGSIPLSGL